MCCGVKSPQVAENACEDWEEAWVVADLVDDGSPQSMGTGCGLSQTSESVATATEGDDVSDEDNNIPPDAHLGHIFPKGLLPRQPWQLALEAHAVSIAEDALLRMVLQMLGGSYGDLVFLDPSGSLTWRNVQLPGVSAEATGALLQRLADLGSLLRRLRAVVALIEALAPPFASSGLLQALGQGLRDGSLATVSGLVQLAEMEESGLVEQPNNVTDVHAFGLCWQSVGLTLSEFLAEFAKMLQKIETRQTQMTLMKALGALEPWLRAGAALEQILDNILASACKRSSLRSSSLPAAVTEELLRGVSMVARSQNLCASCTTKAAAEPSWVLQASAKTGDFRSKPRGQAQDLWCGAARPLLRVAEQWGTLGELHDPCSEFSNELQA